MKSKMELEIEVLNEKVKLLKLQLDLQHEQIKCLTKALEALGESRRNP